MCVLAVVLSLALAHTVASEQVYRRAASDDVSVFELAKQVKSLDVEFSAGIAAAVDALGVHAKAASTTYVDTNINLLRGTVATNMARCASTHRSCIPSSVHIRSNTFPSQSPLLARQRTCMHAA